MYISIEKVLRLHLWGEGVEMYGEEGIRENAFCSVKEWQDWLLMPFEHNF